MKTDWLRKALIAGIAFISFLLVIRFNDFKEQKLAHIETQASSSSQQSAEVPNFETPSTHETSTTSQDDFPQAIASDTSEPSPTVAASESSSSQQRFIQVHTDTLDITIDLEGGDFVKAALPDYPAQIDQPEAFVLMDNTGNRSYQARSGLVGKNGTEQPGQARPIFSAESKTYQLAESQDQLQVDLHFQQSPSVSIIKRFTFNRDSHAVEVSYLVNNQSSKEWKAQLFGDIRRDSYKPTKASMFAMQPYLGAATSTEDKNYKKVNFGDMNDEPFVHSKQGSWVAMVQHYFLTAWIPPADASVKYTLSKVKNQDLYKLQWVGGNLNVAPGQQGSITYTYYAGPKDIKKLEKLAPYLDLTVDYGWLWMIAKPLFFGLDAIHGLVGNWGLAIIIITLLIKLLFFYPSAASYKSMARMRKVQPKMAALKERYGDNRQKFSSEMMKLYREEKVNPIGGCLPMLIQMPVFLSLYWVLMESVQLRQAPFMLWIQDLSVKDPYFVLPLIMGATMWIQQKLNPTPPDPMQAKIMQMMPIFFTFLFLFFPAGLVLYWVVNNSLSITQQYIITKQIEKS